MAEGKQLSFEEQNSMLFANMVIQQAKTALMFLGKVKHPETGETVTDLEAARYFIDQLEMVTVKTKGNLSREEDALLKQSLMNARMAFVEAANSAQSSGRPPQPSAQHPPIESATPESSPAASAAASQPEPSAPAEDAEAKKKFVKKY